jgi:hypothetical protein
MPRQRAIRVHHVARDGRRFVIEELPGRRFPQLRIWDPATRRYRRMTVPVILRDADGHRSPEAMRTAAEQAELLISAMSRGGVTPPRAPTLGDALAYACDPETTKSWEAGNNQLGEWRRARTDALLVLDPDMPLAAVKPTDGSLVAISALYRTALGVTSNEWKAAIARARGPGEPTALSRSVLRAAYEACLPTRTRTCPARDTWAVRAAQLLRAMLRYAAEMQPDAFGAAREFKLVGHLKVEVRTALDRLAQPVSREPARPRYAEATCRDVLRMIRDPRLDLRQLLALVVTDDGAYRVRRSEMRRTPDAWQVRHNNHLAGRAQLTWYTLGPAESAALDALLAGPYATVERTAQERGGYDYRPITDVRWTGTTLTLLDADDTREPDPAATLDARVRLLLDLGIEGRLGQVARAWRSHLSVEGNLRIPLLRVPGRGRKRGPVWLLSETQCAHLAFALEVGYLADLERAYRRHEIDDYALVPSGALREGRAPLERGRKPVHEDTPAKWNASIEAAVGVPPRDTRGNYGFRRAFSDLYDHWSASTRAKNLVTGHQDVHVRAEGQTREEVYLDPEDARLLMEARRLVEHARTVFVETGAGALVSPGGT